MGACLNEQPTVRVVIGPLLPIALVALELDDFADVLEGQVERRLPKLLDELPGVCFVARDRQLIMNRQSHVVLLALWCNALAKPSLAKCRWHRGCRPAGCGSGRNRV